MQPPIIRNPDFVTMNEAAELCGVTRLTIHQWIKAGKLSAVKLDRLVYIEKTSLPTSVNNTIGQRLKSARRASGLKALDVAADLQISRFTLSKYEHDERTPSALHLSLLAHHYGVSAKWLETGHDG